MAARAFWKNDHGYSGCHPPLGALQTLHSIAWVAAVHDDVLGRPHRPAKEWHPQELFLGDPTELKLTQALNQDRNIYIALMVHHKDVLLARIKVLEPANRYRNPRDPQDQPGPEPVDAIDPFAMPVENAEQDRDGRQNNRDE